VEAAPTKPEGGSADQRRAPQADIVLGVIVAPGLARDVTATIASELAHDLEALDLGVEWRTELRLREGLPLAGISRIGRTLAPAMVVRHKSEP
jgi:hypothetical protein